MSMHENFIRQFLKHRKFSPKIADNVDEKTKKTKKSKRWIAPPIEG